MKRTVVTAIFASLMASLVLYASVQGGQEKSSVVPEAKDYMSPALRVRVERLKIEAQLPSDDLKVLEDRLTILWEWVNAYALTGKTIPFDFPLEFMYLYDSTRINPARELQPPGVISRWIDSNVRQFTMKEQTPGAIGQLAFSPAGPFVAGEYATLEEIYTVGDTPMQIGGGIALYGNLFSSLATVDLQTEDPAGDGYLTVRTSNPQARLVKSRIWGDAAAAYRRPQLAFKLEGAELKKGDTITWTFGDRSGGSKGVKMQAWATDSFDLRIYVDLDGTGRFLAPEWPLATVIGREETLFVNAIVRPVIVTPGAPFEVAVRSEDIEKNIISGRAPEYEVLLNGKSFSAVPASDNPVTVLSDLTVSEPGVYRFTVRSKDGRLSCVSNPLWVKDTIERNVYWGDTHGHMSFDDGQGSASGYYAFGRDIARMDFLTCSVHDLWMDDYEWKVLQDMAQQYADPGRFTPILGYEWTAQESYGGHHNVYFSSPEGRRRVPGQFAPDLDRFYEGLREIYKPEDVLIIPHAHMPGDWRRSDAPMERLTEITSGHGTFEWFGNRYLQNGFQVGFIGGSDNHLLKPGYANNYSSYNFGGYAAVLAEGNTSKAIFDALRDRACYATTGERIIVDATLNGLRMGQRLPDSGERALRCRVMGTLPIESIDLVKNGRVIYSKRYLRSALESRGWLQVRFESSSEVFTPANTIPPRAALTWRGSIEIKDARLLGLRKFWSLLPQFESVERDTDAPARIRFSVNTRGRGKGIAIELDEVTPETAVVVDLEPTDARAAAVRTAPKALFRQIARVAGSKQRSAGGDHAFRVGDLVKGPVTKEFVDGQNVDKIEVQIIPADASLDQEFEYLDLENISSGDYYYLRVRQVDGSMAWTSPWWVGGKDKG